MNETVIQNIATQLGISVDQATSMLQTHLPQYGAVMAYQTIMPLIILTIFLIILIIVDVILIRVSESPDNRTQGMRDLITVFFSLCFVATVFIGFLVLVNAINDLPSAISWLTAPDVQLLIEATAAIGG